MAFKDQVLNQQAFRAFAFMRGKSPVIHMAHLVGAFYGLSGMATDVQGKQIAFIGDRGQGRQPIPFILPPQNSWVWVRVRYLNNTARYVEHYRQEEKKTKLWITGATDEDLVEIQLPRLLALPTFLAEFVMQQGGACLPHNLRAFVTTHINGGTSQVPREKWQLILDWCLAASQGERDGSSLLNLGVPKTALCQDNEFLEWCERRLTTTLGQAPAHGGTQANIGGRQDNIQIVERITANMGKSFMAGVQALAPTIMGATRQGGAYERDTGGDGMGGRMYSKNNVAALKGYCGVVDPARIPPIWDTFQQTREISSHRHNLWVSMTKWAKQTGNEIDKAPFFTEQTIKDIVNQVDSTLILIQERRSQRTDLHSGGYPSSRVNQKRHTRWKLSRTMKRHDISRRILHNSMRLDDGRRHHLAPHRIPILN